MFDVEHLKSDDDMDIDNGSEDVYWMHGSAKIIKPDNVSDQIVG